MTPAPMMRMEEGHCSPSLPSNMPYKQGRGARREIWMRLVGRMRARVKSWRGRVRDRATAGNLRVGRTVWVHDTDAPSREKDTRVGLV